MGNPFTFESKEFILVETRDIMHNSVVQTIQSVETLAEQQYRTFVEERIITRQKKIDDPIVKNNIPLFGTKITSKNEKGTDKVLKNNVKLFSQLFIVAQSRGIDLEEFFKYENQSCPPSLAKDCDLRRGTKSEILSCIEELCVTHVTLPISDSTTITDIPTDIVVPDALEPMSTEEVLPETTSDNTVALMSVPSTSSSSNNISEYSVVLETYDISTDLQVGVTNSNYVHCV